MCFSYPQCEEHNMNLTCIFETLVRTGASTQPELGEMVGFFIVYVFLSGFKGLLKDLLISLWTPSINTILDAFSSVQFSCSVVSDSLRRHESQHARPPCPSPSPRVHSDSRPSSPWCHQPSHPLLSPSPPVPNPSQHQSLLQWVNSSHEVAKALELQL